MVQENEQPIDSKVAPTVRLTRSRQEQVRQHEFNVEQTPENPVYPKKEELAFGLNQNHVELLLDIGLKVNIHNAYTQNQPNKKSRTSVRSTYHV